MKKFLFILSIAFALSVVVTSCSKKDPCEGVTCQNGGTCEGGDNHFRKEFYQALRKLAYENDFLLIF